MEKQAKWRVQWQSEIENINADFTEHRFTAIRELRMACVHAVQNILFDDDLNYEHEILQLLDSYRAALNILAHAYLHYGEIAPT